MTTKEIRQYRYSWDDKALDTSNTVRYDSYRYRIARYAGFRYSYSNLMYTSLFRGFLRLRSNHQLYKYVRGLYNPVYKLIETIGSYMYGGAIDREFRYGALPITVDNAMNRDNLVGGLQYLSRTSDFRQLKSNYARWCANLGDCFLVVQDNIEYGFVKIEVIEPDKVYDYRLNDDGSINYIQFVYTELSDDELTETHYIYEMTQESFTLYQSHGLTTLDRGRIDNLDGMRQVEQRPNPYGFVPVVHQKFTDVGNQYGANAYFAQFNIIHALNDILSVTYDGIRKNVDTVYAYEGGMGELKGEKITVGRDGIPIIYLPTGKLEPLLSTLNIADTAAFIHKSIERLENDMPVLAMQAIRDMSIISEPAIALAYGDSIKRIEDMQNILDSGLERAITMALAIAGYRGYIAGFSLDYAQTLDIGWSFVTRDVLKTTVDSTTKLNALSNADINNPLIEVLLRYMDVPEDDIQKALQTGSTIRTENANAQLLNATRSRLDEIRSAGRQINQQRDDNGIQE